MPITLSRLARIGSAGLFESPACACRTHIRRSLALIVAAAVLVAPALAADPGLLPQTTALPSGATARFHARMNLLWRGILADSPAAAQPAFFPGAAYVQVKQIANPAADYQQRLLGGFRLDLAAAHRLVGGHAQLLSVSVPPQWAWIPPGGCFNRVGYWHAPGARIVYRAQGRVRSFGIYSLISWRGEWYVVHLGPWNQPGTVYSPALGAGAFGPPGGC